MKMTSMQDFNVFINMERTERYKEKKLVPHVQKIRNVGEIHKHGHGLYRRIISSEGGLSDFVENVYEGWEHKPEDRADKLPNITHFWNLPFENLNGFLYASSMGHLHPPADFDVQEVYEFFQGHGGMLIAKKGKTKLWVCKPGDKVLVPPDCVMTILNFSYRDLVTLDMANPDTNESSKDILAEKDGPMLAFYNPQGDVSRMKIKINPAYAEFGIRASEGKDIEIFDESGCGAGAGYTEGDTSTIDFKFGSADEDALNKVLLKRHRELRRKGIEVEKAAPNIRIKGRDGKTYLLDKPLSYLLFDEDKPLHRALGMV